MRLCGGLPAVVYVNPPVTESSRSRLTSPGTQEESFVLDYLNDFCFKSSFLPSCPMRPTVGILPLLTLEICWVQQFSDVRENKLVNSAQTL